MTERVRETLRVSETETVRVGAAVMTVRDTEGVSETLRVRETEKVGVGAAVMTVRVTVTLVLGVAALLVAAGDRERVRVTVPLLLLDVIKLGVGNAAAGCKRYKKTEAATSRGAAAARAGAPLPPRADAPRGNAPPGASSSSTPARSQGSSIADRSYVAGVKKRGSREGPL